VPSAASWIGPIAVSAYVEQHEGSPATDMQHLAANRPPFNWLVTGAVLDRNPAEPVKGYSSDGA